jgi:CHRD domain-containing protein
MNLQSATCKVQRARARWIVPVLVLGAAVVSAQAPRTLRARLSPVPIDVSMQATIAGSGSVTATLEGTTLTLHGTYQGLKTPATVARLHRAFRGTRGPSFAELKVSGGTTGTITGAVALTNEQVGELGKSLFYVQLHSEKAPDGNLWGWLLPDTGKPK